MLESKSTLMCCFTQASSSFNVFKIKGQVFPRMENKWSLCVFNILHKRDSCSRTFATLRLIKSLIIEPETLLLPEQCIGPALARGGQTCEQQLSSDRHPRRGRPCCGHMRCCPSTPLPAVTAGVLCSPTLYRLQNILFGARKKLCDTLSSWREYEIKDPEK